MNQWKIVLCLCCLGLLLVGAVPAPAGKEPKVVLISIDGLRWQDFYRGADLELIYNKEYVKDTIATHTNFYAAEALERRKLLMPFFWSVVAHQGRLYGNRDLGSHVNCSNQMWFSYPGYNEILTGFADDKRIWSNRKMPNPNVTVLEAVNKQPGFQGEVAAFCSWDAFPYIINEQRSKVYVNAGFEKSDDLPLSPREEYLNRMIDIIPSPWNNVRLDAFTHEYGLEYAKKHHPRLVYLSYGETDDFAHDGRYDHYLFAARRVDGFIKEWWDYLQSDPFYKDQTTLLVVTDHGRGTQPLNTWKDHSIHIPGADQIWMAALGPAVAASGELREHIQLYQNQMAATVAACLGLPYTNDPAPGPPIPLTN